MNQIKLLQITGILVFLVQISYSQVGIGTTTPTAQLEIIAGTTAIAPVKLNSGINLTSPQNGAVEYDGTNYFVTSGGIRYILAKILTASATINFNNLNDNDDDPLVSSNITVTGAQIGDPVIIGLDNTVMDSTAERRADYQAWVSATNTVTIRFANTSQDPCNPDSATFKVAVIRY